MSSWATVARIGIRRGWHEFVLGLRSPQDQLFYVMMSVGSLAWMWSNRDEPLGVGTLTLPQVALPSLLAAIVTFSIVVGPAYALALEREDGTLLRCRIAPYGLHGYLIGVITLSLLALTPMLTILLGGATLLFDRAVPADPGRGVLIVAALGLGILATMPLGFVIGSLVPRVQQVTTWGMAPIIVLAWISGIFGGMQQLWPWVQVLAQAFPLYWLGHLMRAAFLPEAAAVGELRGSWQPAIAITVLGAWAVLGTLLATPLVRRMARRQSGAAVAEARDQAITHVVR